MTLQRLIELKVYLKRKKKKRKKKKKTKYFSFKDNLKIQKLSDIIKAPADFRFIENNSECLEFFSKLRSRDFMSVIKPNCIYRISLKNIQRIDFASITILKTIMDEYALNGLIIKSNLPENEECKRFLIKTGFFTKMYSQDMTEINYKGDSDFITLKRNISNKLTDELMDSFDDISDKVFEHLHKKTGYFDELIVALKELGTNAIEWSQSYNNLWQIGVFYDDQKVLINVVDLGEGIIESLYRLNKLSILDFFVHKSNLSIITSAYKRKYGSLSQEENRNKGLPFIRNIFLEKNISNLYVCTNNVFMDFNTPIKNIEYRYPNCTFKGTFYQWEITSKNIY